MMHIPDFLKSKRREVRFTQQDLAHRAGVGLRFIRELEQGKQTLRMDKVNQVLKLFNASLGPVNLLASNSLKGDGRGYGFRDGNGSGDGSAYGYGDGFGDGFGGGYGSGSGPIHNYGPSEPYE